MATGRRDREEIHAPCGYSACLNSRALEYESNSPPVNFCDEHPTTFRTARDHHLPLLLTKMSLPIRLLSQRPEVFAPELLSLYDGPVITADCYVVGAESWNEVTGGYEHGRILNVDHHAPTQRMQREIREDRTLRQNEELASIQELAQKAISEIAEKEKFDLILQDAVYVSPRIDITDKVIKALADK